MAGATLEVAALLKMRPDSVLSLTESATIALTRLLRFPSVSCWGSDADSPKAPDASTARGGRATAPPSLA